MISSSLLRFSSIVALLLCAVTSRAVSQQRLYEKWYFGFNVGIDFAQVPPQKIFGSLFSREGCASICNSATGALLFYTNGVSVWTRNHTVMKNGTGLFGSLTTTQSATIVPKPGAPDIYYIFTAYAGPAEPLPVGGARQISYSTVDMRREGGAGEVIEKNVFMMQPTTEKLVVVQHCNGVDFWVIGHELGSSRFFTWLVTAAGVSETPVITDIGRVHVDDPGATGAIGYLKASPDGRFLFSIVQQDGFGDLLEFNSESGVIERLIAAIPAHYGASFSPNSELLYVEYSVRSPELNRYVVVYNGSVLDAPSILGTKARIAQLPLATPPRSFRALQIGPDRQIYVGVDKHVGVIDNPDQGGTFRDSAITYEPPDVIGDSISTNGFPNCIDGFLASTPVQSCAAPITAKFIQSDTAICEGETVDFVDESFDDPDSWRWAFQGGRPASSTERNPKGIQYDRAGSYTIRLIASNGRSTDTAFGTILVHPKPVAEAGSDRVICTGDTVHLNASGGGSYRWTPSGELTCGDCPDPVATPTGTTIYTVIVTNEFGCQDIDSVRVEVLPRITIVSSSDTTICLGQSVQLTVSGADRYEWSPADGLSCTDCPNPIATPLKTTTYGIRGTAGSGNCFDSATITVVVNEPPTADAGTDTGVCLGGSVRLRASGGALYRWDASPDLSCLDCFDPVVTPSQRTTYRVRVVNEGGCEAFDSVTVEVYPLPLVDAGEDRAICLGGSVRLTASGGMLYRWEESPGLSCLDCPDPVATPMRTTTYRVTVTDARGCRAMDSVTVEIHPAPAVDAGENRIVCPGDSVRLTASGGIIYQWDPSPDLSCFDCPDPVVSPPVPTVYYVTITDADGCRGRDSVTVDLYSFSISIVPEQSVCPGDTIQLYVNGGAAWLWEPAEGLSCVDCPDPLAFPTATTTYRVTARSAEGCKLTGTTLVRVRENGEVVRARIRRDYRAYPGNPVVIPVELVDDVSNSDIGELLLELEYDRRVMVLDIESVQRLLAGTLLEGWSLTIVDATPGRATVRLTAPQGQTLSGRGVLLLFEGRLYLSEVNGTELPLRLSSPSNCFAFAPEPGYVQLDSICGLNLRLIESSAEKYVAPIAYPNPASDRVRFTFGLGLAGRASLEVFNAGGNRVGLLVNEVLNAGSYQVEWDVRNVSSGIYWYRLSSGDWIKTGQVRIRR